MTPAAATLLIFLHGFGSSPQKAIRDYHLDAIQHKLLPEASLMVPPARKSAKDPIPATHLPFGTERAILIVYSGAGRQVIPLLTDPRVCCLLLLDAIYRKSDALDFLAWSRQPFHHLVVIANGTYANTHRWAPGLPIIRTNTPHAQIPKRLLEFGLGVLLDSGAKGMGHNLNKVP
jgi:hypothetical protein